MDRQYPWKKQESIFRPGYSSKNSTGLGLSIVKQLVEEMNGRIRLNSNLEAGTEFIIEIPILTQPLYSTAELTFSEHAIKKNSIF